MTPYQFYRSQPKKRINAVVEAAGTSFDYFKQIALGYGSASKALAERLAKASDQTMTEIEILYPERFK